MKSTYAHYCPDCEEIFDGSKGESECPSCTNKSTVNFLATFTSGEEIARLQKWIDDLQSGMYINCVYCGHRYGPNDPESPPMREVLEKHIESCPKHPLSLAKEEIARLTHLHELDHSLADQWQEKNEAMMQFFIAAEFGNLPRFSTLNAEKFKKLGEVVGARTKEAAAKAKAYDALFPLVSIAIANAVVGPDAAMKGATDCYHVPLDDIDALRITVKP